MKSLKKGQIVIDQIRCMQTIGNQTFACGRVCETKNSRFDIGDIIEFEYKISGVTIENELHIIDGELATIFQKKISPPDYSEVMVL